MTDVPATAAVVPLPNEIVRATFGGQIDQAAVQRVFHAFSVAVNNGIKQVHMLLHSAGGNVPDGICLYNYFRALPIEVSVYNAGAVSSIAVVAFLGAKHRYASANASFLIHKAFFSPMPSADAARLRGLTESLILDDTRIENILKTHLKIPEDRWSVHPFQDLVFDAPQAKQYGLIEEIRDFDIPAGTQLFNIN